MKNHNKWHLLRAIRSWFLVLTFTFANIAVNAQEQLPEIGQVVMAKGVVTAQSKQRGVTTLAKGSAIYLHDIIETATRSFVVIKFNDGGKITLRPESRFDIQSYNAESGKENQSFELLKGGLRAVTGAIGKAQPDKVKYTAQNTTIGIRGTTLVIRLCQEGEDGCQLNRQASTLGDDLSTKKYLDIFIVDKSGGVKQRITRQQLRRLLSGVYVSVIDGAIRIESDAWFVDMAAGDKCLIDYSDDPGRMRESDSVECFVPGQGVEDIDVYLSDDAESISLFNLFDGGELNAGAELCEIN